MYNQIPLLTSKDVDVRIQSVKQNKNGVGAILLIYKDARVDMNMLDEVYGQNNWQRTHEIISGNLFCNIDIWDEEKKQWVRKQDVGVESNAEPIKGQASDAFKRTCFNVGIGRELYTAPFTYVPLNAGEYYEKNGRISASPFLKFHVTNIGYDDNRSINKLIIADNKGVVRFELGKFIKAEVKTETNPETKKQATPAKTQKLVMVDKDGTKLLKLKGGWRFIGEIEKDLLIKMLASGYYEEARPEIIEAINKEA